MILKILFLNILGFQTLLATFHKDRKILVNRLSDQWISQAKLSDYQRNVRNNVLEHLRRLPANDKEYLTDNAALEYETGQQKPFEAWSFLEYSRNGQRKKYESIIFDNVRRLSVLIVGHLLDELEDRNTQLYLDDIFSETYRFLELSTWVWPAHLTKFPTKDENIIDLGAGEVAKQIAWIKVLMGPKFERIEAGSLNERIDQELGQRIFEPYVLNSYSWDGLSAPDSAANNWNVWINTNILKSAFLTLKDEQLMNTLFNRSLKSVDVFLNNYGDDGGCEEGPAYWREASGRLSEYLQVIAEVIPEAKEYFQSILLLKSIGEYSWKLRIKDNWFVNFGDSPPEIVYPPWHIWNYAQLFDDQVMKNYSAFMLIHNSSEYLFYSQPLQNFKDLNDFVSFVEIKDELVKYEPTAPEPDSVILEQLNIVLARSRQEFNGSSSLLFAGKMGTNYESHSQNDIASFVLFQNNLPVLIDIGVGTYTSKTFSVERYTLFYMQSRYHNCPTINGYNQLAGIPHRSNNVRINNNSTILQIEANIENAYPRHANIKSYVRSMAFDYEKNRLVLKDKYQLGEYKSQTKLNFVTTSGMDLMETSYGLLMSNTEGVKMRMYFKWSQFDMEGEFRSFDGDTRLINIWGEGVKHFMLATNPEQKLLDNEFTIVFQAED